MVSFKVLMFILCQNILLSKSHDINLWLDAKNEVLLADSLLDTINENEDPCTDFYVYSCGRFTSNVNWVNPSITVTDIKKNEYLSELRTLLHAPKQLKEAEAMWKAKDFYTACMRTRNQEKIESLKTYIVNVFGGWPLLENEFWNIDHFNWFDVNGYLIKSGFNDVGFFDIFFDSSNNSQLILDVTSPALKKILMKFNYTTSEADKYLIPMISRVIKYLEGDESEYQIEEIADLVKFINDYFALLDIYETSKHSVNDYTFVDLESDSPGLAWTVIIKRLRINKTHLNMVINVHSHDILEKIITLVEMTNKRIIANYMILNLITSFYMNNEIFTDFKMRKSTFLPIDDLFHVGEKQSVDNKFVYCVKHSAQILHAVRAMHFSYYVTTYQKLTFMELESHIQSAYLEINKNISFIDYLIQISDHKFLDDMYQLLPSHPTDHVTNLLNMKRFKAGWMLNKHTDNVDFLGSFEHINERIGTFYNGNGIEHQDYPQYLMRGITFSREKSHALNYGMYGFKLTQALIAVHGAQLASLHNSSTKICLRKQLEDLAFIYPEFDAYLQNYVHIIQKDIVTDEISLQIAYSAYNDHWLKQNQLNNTLPGVNRTNRQLFWLGYAHMYCHIYDEEILPTLKNIYPQKFRVISVLQNMPQFAQDYNCLERL